LGGLQKDLSIYRDRETGNIKMDNHFLDYFDCIFKKDVFKGQNRREQIKIYLYKFAKTINNIAFELRNPSSHQAIMPYWTAVYCGNLIFMKDNFLFDFLNKVKPDFLK